MSTLTLYFPHTRARACARILFFFWDRRTAMDIPVFYAAKVSQLGVVTPAQLWTVGQGERVASTRPVCIVVAGREVGLWRGRLTRNG